MVTTCLIILLVVIAWFAFKTYTASTQAKLEQTQQRQFELTHWKKESEHGSASVERTLSYAEMRMVTEVSDYSDGGYLADMYSRQKTSWERDHEELKQDGWTEREWMKHDLQEFDVRRLPDGSWEGRLTWKHWKARVRRALERRFSLGEDDFKQLTGITKKEWQERGDYYDDSFRSWQKITDDAPAIEAGYQRFIHTKA